MRTKNHNYYRTYFVAFSVRNILRLILGCIVFFQQIVFSNADTADDKLPFLEVTETVTDDEADSVKPVEVGPGGDIKLEGKYRTQAESLFDWHAHMLWENRYVTEGRDNLSGKGLVSMSSEFTMDGLSVIPWIADSPAADYSEFNLNLIYGTKLLDNLEIYLGYNHIRSRDSGVDSNDNEISLDLSSSQLKQQYVLASIYHSFETDGSFMELAVKQGYRIDQSMHASARVVVGINDGYAPDGHKGLNHFQIRANFAYHPTKEMEIYAYTGYNRAINRDEIRYAGDQLLGNYFWAGMGITYRF